MLCHHGTTFIVTMSKDDKSDYYSHQWLNLGQLDI